MHVGGIPLGRCDPRVVGAVQHIGHDQNRQHADDAQHHHQLDQGETTLAVAHECRKASVHRVRGLMKLEDSQFCIAKQHLHNTSCSYRRDDYQRFVVTACVNPKPQRCFGDLHIYGLAL